MLSDIETNSMYNTHTTILHQYMDHYGRVAQVLATRGGNPVTYKHAWAHATPKLH